MIEEKIRRIFAGFPDILYGFTSISYSPYADKYSSALVFAVPYGGQVLEGILAQMEGALSSEGAPYSVPPVAQSSEVDLAAPFSFKYALITRCMT